jgi:glycosyltransferase involved in cell wall biosynthesis
VGPESVTSPRAAVIVPVRNRRDLLRQALDGLWAQTFTDFEVVVVDDASTDGSAEEAERDARSGRPLRVLRTTGVGAVRARQLGVESTSAEIVAFTDSDCVAAPDWLAHGIEAIDSGADVVQGATMPPRPVRPLERAVWSVRDDGLFATCNVFYRRVAFDAAGGFDETAGSRLGFRPGSRLRGLGFGEDTLLGWRVRRSGTATFAPDAVVFHAVLPPDIGDLFRRAWTTGAFPALSREVPELRPLLAADVRRGRASRALLAATIAAAASARWTVALSIVGAWGAWQWRHLAPAEPSRRRRAEVLPAVLALDAVREVALMWGNVRSRTLLA